MSVWRNRTSIGATRIALGLRIAAFLVFGMTAIYLLFIMPSAPSVAVIEATTESVSFQVSVPEMAQLRLNGYSLSFESGPAVANLGFRETTLASRQKPLCLSGLLVPEPGTKITYKRFGTNPVSIVLEQPNGKQAASFEFVSGALPAAARTASWIRLDAPPDSEKERKGGCEGVAATRLPLYGAVEIGSELRPPGRGEEPSAGLLLEGKLDLFVQAFEMPFSRREAPLIYPGPSIALPPGSKVMEYAGVKKPFTAWSGFVQADADKALTVKVTTPVDQLAIVRPGLGLQPEVLSTGLFTQLTNDPTLISAQVTALFLFYMLQMLSSVFANRAGRDN